MAIDRGQGIAISTELATSFDVQGLIDDATAAKVAAQVAKAAAELDLDNFDDRYLGVKAVEPTLDNDGDALIEGAMYFDTTLTVTKIYDLASTTWNRTTPTVTDQATINIVSAIDTDVTTVAGKATEIGILGTADAVADMNTLGTTAIVADINTVAGISANTTTVAGISANVTTVAGISADVTAVKNDATDIGLVAAKATEIGRLGTADAVTDLNTLGTADVVADMNVLATADVVADMNTLGTTTNVTNLATCAGDITAIQNASAAATNAATSEGNASNSSDDAGKYAVTVEDTQFTLSDGVTTGYSALHYAAKAETAQTAAETAQTAAELALDTFGDTYLGAKASDPALDNDGDALTTGDLYFNTTTDSLKAYTGSAWISNAMTEATVLQIAQDSYIEDELLDLGWSN